MNSPRGAAPEAAQTPSFSRSARCRLFIISFLATLPIVATLMELNGRLQNRVASQGVMSFELARTLVRQSEILASWSGPETLRLAFSVGLDFLFVPTFLSTMTFACICLRGFSGGRSTLGSRLAWLVAWCVLVMGVFWIVQNVLLAEALFGHGTALTAQIIYWCAVVKFGVMIASSAFIVIYTGVLVFPGIFFRAA
jgi:hypothetical protein